MCLKSSSKTVIFTNWFFFSLVSRQVTFDEVTVANIQSSFQTVHECMSEYFYAWWQQEVPSRAAHIWSTLCDVQSLIKLRARSMQQDKSLNMTPVRNRHLQAIERIMFLPG